MLAIAESALSKSASQQSVYNICRTFHNTSFVFNVNNYEIVIHNVSAVSVDITRILYRRNICTMCVYVDFEPMSVHTSRY